MHNELVMTVSGMMLLGLPYEYLKKLDNELLLSIYNNNNHLTEEQKSIKAKYIKIILNFNTDFKAYDLWNKNENELRALYYMTVSLTKEDIEKFNNNPMLKFVQYQFFKELSDDIVLKRLLEVLDQKNILLNKLKNQNMDQKLMVELKGDLFDCENKILLLKMRLNDIRQKILGNVTNQELIDELVSLEKELQFWMQQHKSDLESYAEEVNSSNKSAREQDIRDDERNINNIQARISEINQQIFSSSTGGRR